MVGDHQIGRHRSKMRVVAVKSALALTVIMLMATTPIAAAEDYPTRPITLVVGYAAGGGNDIMARVAAEKMSPLIGQQIVIENRGGAGGSIATRAVAKAAPDGYTLVIGGTGTLAINPTLYSNVGYDPRKDFAPIGLIGTSALVLVVHPSIPAHNVKELIAYAKANPGKLTYASAGVGSGIHLSTEYFRFEAGIEMTHVPYKGSAPMLTDLLAGQVQVTFDNLPSSIGHIKAGKLRALAVTTAQRSAELPDVPTVAETVPGYEASAFFGLVAPKGTPPEVIEVLNKEINAALKDSGMQAKLKQLGGTPIPGSAADFGKLLAGETAKWEKVVHAANLSVD